MLTAEVMLVNRATIAIEGQLSHYGRVLEEAGFHVVPLDHDALGIAQAIVVQGTNNNLLGIQDPESLAPVINAEGMTPDEVLSAVEARAIHRH